jgi:cobalt-zinc-cadmium efflux system membrane fusion protein
MIAHTGLPSVVLFSLCAALAACGTHAETSAGSGAPPPVVIDRENDGTTFQVQRPERFAVTAAVARDAESELSVTGVVTPDISRTVPVVSLASGRVAEIRARLGDHVDKGQVLARIQSPDVSAAMADFLKATAAVHLAETQLARAKRLYARGALAQKDVETATDAAERAAVDFTAAEERVKLLGGNPAGTPTLIDVVAPTSGVITEQNVTAAAGVKSLDNSPNLFTIADLTHVWIMCDVYENDLPAVREGETTRIRVTAYPDQPISGRISNISPILDPNLRTAKVRVEVSNPGILRVGMFVTATFRGFQSKRVAAVPASAILHLHDRDWVYISDGQGQFRRAEVVSGRVLPGNVQEVRSGVQPGDRVVANALVFQNTVDE